jgi:hypothetical protein
MCAGGFDRSSMVFLLLLTMVMVLLLSAVAAGT